METKIINVGENPEELRYQFIKNASVKSKMTLNGFNQATVIGKTYFSDIPPLTLFFTSFISEVNNDTAVKIMNVYNIKDDIIANNSQKNIDDIKKMNIKLKFNSLNEYLDVDISGVNKDNKMVLDIAESLRHQYTQMRKFPTEPIGIGGSWCMSINNDNGNYTYLYTLREKNKSIIKYDYILNFNLPKDKLVSKNNEISLYKEFYGSGIANISADIATGETEMRGKNFSASVSEMKDMSNQILCSEQTLLTTVEFYSDVYDNENSNINNILTNIKNNKLYS